MIIPKKYNKTIMPNEMYLAFVLDPEFLEEIYAYNLPHPNFLRFLKNGHGELSAVHVGWLINGFLGTRENKAFFADIVTRFIKTFIRYKPEYELVYNDYLENKNVLHDKNKCGLRDFSKKLESIKTKALPPQRSEAFDDHKFWAIKLHAEDVIRQNQFVAYEQLENFALLNFPEAEKSTIRAKCRSIWNWYDKRDFRLKEKKYESLEAYYKETKMTRTEHIKNVNAKKIAENREKIEKLLSGLFANDYKKKSGAWHIAKIADVLGLNRKTVSKYLNEKQTV